MKTSQMNTLVIPEKTNDGKPVREISREYLSSLVGFDEANEIVIPNSVTSIRNNALLGCGKLETIAVSPENGRFKDIDGVLFSKDGKTLIKVPEGRVFKDGTYAIPNSVTSIGHGAFEGCKSLIDVVISESVIKIGDDAFAWCEKLERITVSPENGRFKDIDGVLFLKDGKTLIKVPEGRVFF